MLSTSVTVNVSLPVAPLSARLMPEIAVSWLMPSVCAPGTVITGVTLAVTATVAGVAALPKLSLAVSVIVSGPAELSVSFSVPRSAFTWLSVPLMTRSVELLPDVAPLADSNPLLSFSVTVKVSLPVVLPLSARLTPAIAVAVPSATVCAPGTAITGAPFAVTAIVCRRSAVAKAVAGIDGNSVRARRAIGVLQRAKVAVQGGSATVR